MSTPKPKETTAGAAPDEKIGELCAILGDLYQRLGAGHGPTPFRAPGSDVRFAGYQPYPLPEVALRHAMGAGAMAPASPFVSVM